MPMPQPPHNGLPLLQGHTRTFPLSDVLLALGRNKASGVLYLEPSGIRLHLNAGYVDAVEGAEPLGQTLLRLGLLEAQQLENFQPGSLPLGQTLVGQGKLRNDQLWWALVAQAREGVARLVRLSQQTYVMWPTQSLPKPVVQMSIVEALLEALHQRPSAAPNDPIAQ